jgi:hypothetical protein
VALHELDPGIRRDERIWGTLTEAANDYTVVPKGKRPVSGKSLILRDISVARQAVNVGAGVDVA